MYCKKSVLPALVFLLLCGAGTRLHAQYVMRPVLGRGMAGDKESQIQVFGDTLVCSRFDDGIYVSSDNGFSWDYRGLRGLSIQGLTAFDARNFLVLGRTSSNWPVYRTTNVGISWTQVAEPDLIYPSRLKQLSNDEAVIIDQKYDGPCRVLSFHRDRDEMQTLFTGSDTLSDIAKTGDRSYVGISVSNNIKRFTRTTDGGITWSEPQPHEVLNNMRSAGVNALPGGGLIVTGVPHSGFQSSVFLSTDSGASFEILAEDIRLSEIFYTPYTDVFYGRWFGYFLYEFDLQNHLVRTYDIRDLNKISGVAALQQVGSTIWHLMSNRGEHYYSSDNLTDVHIINQVKTTLEQRPFIYHDYDKRTELAYLSRNGTSSTENGFYDALGDTLVQPTPFPGYNMDAAFNNDGRFLICGQYGHLYYYSPKEDDWVMYKYSRLYVSGPLYFDPYSDDLYAYWRRTPYERAHRVAYSTDQSKTWQMILEDNEYDQFDYVRTMNNGRVYCIRGLRIQSATIGEFVWTEEIVEGDEDIYMLDTDDPNAAYAVSATSVYRYEPGSSSWTLFFRPSTGAQFFSEYGDYENCIFDVNPGGNIVLYDFRSDFLYYYESAADTWTRFEAGLQYAYPKKAILTLDNIAVISTYAGLFKSAPLGQPATPVDPTESAGSFTLHQNYPNPFNPGTQIEYELPATAAVTIRVTDALGRTVLTADEGSQSAGVHSWHADLTGRPSGLYFYTVRAGDAVQTKKMMLVR